jgi:hypothetical protein
MENLLIVGERRSPLAIKRDVRWEDEALAAVPLFEALRAAGIDPTSCRFVNWFEDGEPIVRNHTGRIVALGQKVQKALTAEGIEHIPLVHPAARGKIRLRANYIAHVVSTMTEALGLPVCLSHATTSST